VNQPFSFQILASGALSFNASNLPANVFLNTATGLISGTPNDAVASFVTLEATNYGGTATAQMTIDVQQDADSDGMGDAWEAFFGLDPTTAADAQSDIDGDGQSNESEWRAGTSPTDPTARFHIVNQELSGEGVRITWTSTPGKRYRLQSCSDLAAGVWVDVTPDPIAAAQWLTGWTDSIEAVGGVRFYRVELLP
jgi:hypothetical protein